MNIQINDIASTYASNYIATTNKTAEQPVLKNNTIVNQAVQNTSVKTTPYSDTLAENASVTYGVNAASNAGSIIGSSISSNVISGAANVSKFIGRSLQTALKTLGFYSGSIDGNLLTTSFGKAYKNFERVFNGTVTGKYSSSIVNKISTVATKYSTCLKSSGMKKIADEKSFDSTQKHNAALTWVFLREGMGLTKAQAAGVMGNLHEESLFSNDNAQESQEYYGKHNPEYVYSTKDYVGYGLMQWTMPERKERLQYMASVLGTSVSDVTAQLACMRYELTECDLKDEWNTLKTKTTYSDVSDYFLDYIENPKENDFQDRRNLSYLYYSNLT